MKLVLPYPPRANTNWRLMRGHMVLNSTSREYRKQVTRLAAADCIQPMLGPVRVTVRVYRPRRSGDLDGRLKVLFDALNGVAWGDDSQVCEIHAYRHEDKENPRAEVEVLPALP